jgi:hypothetical protein
MSALYFLDRAGDDIYTILSDSTIDDSEKEKFCNIMKTLGDISRSTQSLEIWAKRKGLM